MLSVRRPEMGSTQPSESNLPFGYSFDTPDDFFLDPPPGPAPGNRLLSDSDSRMLSSFFENMTADQYDAPSFGEGLNYTEAWLQLPPQFMGSSTSLGQAPTSHDMLSQDFSDLGPLGTGMMPPPPLPLSQQQHPAISSPHQPHTPTIDQQHHPPPSADVLAAASLLQHSTSPRHGGQAGAPLFTRREFAPSLGPPVGHLRHQAIEDFRRAEPPSAYVNPDLRERQHSAMFAAMVFGPEASQGVDMYSPTTAETPRASHYPAEMQWGTDARFSRTQSFVPDSDRETYDALSRSQLRVMECLEPSQSASNTRPPTPTDEHTPLESSKKTWGNGKADKAPEEPPTKRRRNQTAAEDLEDDGETAAGPSKSARKRRSTKADSSTAAAQSSEGSGTANRRRKSATGAKPARENLTEAQKRENHIRSEQKRRTLIKEGFDDLCDLVPGLKGGGFSKSTMLTMAADWLEELVKGNNELTAQLDGLQNK